MVSFVRKGLLLLSVTIAASAILGVSAAYATSGGGCNTSPDGNLGACISEDSSRSIVTDAYVNGSFTNCTLAIGLYDNGNLVAVGSISWQVGGGHFVGPNRFAQDGHTYYAIESLNCNNVHELEGSPPQYSTTDVGQGGGCYTNPGNNLGACISEDSSRNIVSDAYVNGSAINCTLNMTLYVNGNFAGFKDYFWSGGGHDNHYLGPSVPATANAYYYMNAVLSCDNVNVDMGSPPQYA